jgi:hypothetical protein
MDGECSKAGGMRNAYKILAGKPELREHLGNIGVHGRLILKWIV